MRCFLLVFVLLGWAHGATDSMSPGEAEAMAKVDRLNEVLAGQPLSATAERITPKAPDPGQLALRMSMGLAIVLILLWFLVVLVRRMRGEGGSQSTGGSPRILQVLETAHLGSGQKVVVLRLGERVVAVGATSDSVQTLCTVEGEEAARLLSSSGQATSVQFGATVNHLLRHFKREQQTNLRPRNSGEQL